MIIFYDLEFIGDLRESVGQCRIYEIAAVSESGYEFHSYVDPGDPYDNPIVGSLPDRKLLKEPLFAVMERFFLWANIGGDVYMVSHGNFRSDQLVLCAQSVRFPDNFFFADSLMITRAMVQSPRFSLSFLYDFLGHGEIADPHTALQDARALRTIMNGLQNWTQFACVYRPHDTALSNLRGIGAKTELYLQSSGFDIGNTETWGCLDMLSLEQQRILREHAAAIWSMHSG